MNASKRTPLTQATLRAVGACLAAAAMLSACGGASPELKGGEPKTGSAPADSPSGVAVPPAYFAVGDGQVVEASSLGSGVVALRLLFYTGAADDPPGKEGLTALTAQLMAEGGTKSMTYPQILRALYPLASEISVQVDKEQTVFTAEAHPDTVARLVPILAEIVKAPAFAQADFNRLRQDAINDIEKRLCAADDENLGKATLELMLYPRTHPYGHYVGGTVEGLRSITVEDVRAQAARVFGKKRLLIGIGGNFDPRTRQALVDALRDLPDGEPRLAQIPRVSRPPRTRVLIAEKPTESVAISIGYPHDQRRGTSDFFPLALVQSYFGEHRQFHGVLMQEMREKRGLNYGDFAYVEKFIQSGGSRNVRTNIARRQQGFEIWLRPVKPDDAVFSVRLALYLLDRLIKGGVPASGVEDTRTFLTGYTRLWDLTASRKLGYALDDQFYGTSGYLDGYRAALLRMTPDGVNGALVRNLVSAPVDIAIVAPDGEKLRRQLLSGAPSPKKYDAKVDEAILAADKEVEVFPLGLQEADVRVVKAADLFVR